MDGLLLDTERLASVAFGRACAALSLASDDFAYDRLIGLKLSDAAPLLQAWLAETGTVSLDVFRRAWDGAYHDILAEGIPVKAGADSLLSHLRDCGMPCAVATSTTSRLAYRKLEQAGLAAYLAVIVGGDQVKAGKPAPDIYLRAASEVAADPLSCLAFEDSDNGVRAALAAGMTVVQVPDMVPPGPALRALGHDIEVSLLQAAMNKGLYPRSG